MILVMCPLNVACFSEDSPQWLEWLTTQCELIIVQLSSLKSFIAYPNGIFLLLWSLLLDNSSPETYQVFEKFFLYISLLSGTLSSKLQVYLLSQTLISSIHWCCSYYLHYCYLETTSWQKAKEIIELIRDYKWIHFSKGL